MPNPNKSVWNARHKKTAFQYQDIAKYETRELAEEAAKSARASGKWSRVKVQEYNWTGFVYLKGVPKSDR